MTSSKKFDLVVVGSGPGGYVAAIRAAQLGLKTAIVEKAELGGICLNWGCIPSKALLTNATVYRSIQNSEKWGIRTSQVEFDIKQIIGRSRDVASTLSKGVAYLMKKNKIEVVRGTARFDGSRCLQVKSDNDEPVGVESDHTVIATGARARAIPGIEVDGKTILNYRHALALREMPESILIIGAGAIGCEFAYFYNSFGAQVTLIEMMDSCLPLEDPEVGAELEKSFKKQGIETLTNTRVSKAKTDGEKVVLEIEDSDGERREIKADKALNAVGVIGNVEDLGLEEIGVQVEKNQIQVDQWYRTGVDGVYAIGDVIGAPLLAHVASHEGIVCVEKIAGQGAHPVDYRTLPVCTYCQPQVASVGLTEPGAKEEGYKVRVGKFPFQVLGKAKASQSTEGFVKLIFDDEYGELLGAHIIGEEATEMIAELVTAKALETTYLELLKTPHAHPTLSEAVMEAAGMAYGEQIHL